VREFPFDVHDLAGDSDSWPCLAETCRIGSGAVRTGEYVRCKATSERDGQRRGTVD